jgi:hypothetical protein
MAQIELKEWFRRSIRQYLPIISGYVRDEIGRVAGRFIGGFETYAEMAATPARNGDWAILRTDDPAGPYESGIYVLAAGALNASSTFVTADNDVYLASNGGSWEFVADLTTIDELTEKFSAAFALPISQPHNTESVHDVDVFGVKLARIPTVLALHTLAIGVSVRAEILADDKIRLTISNRSGANIAAGSQISIEVKQ